MPHRTFLSVFIVAFNESVYKKNMRASFPLQEPHRKLGVARGKGAHLREEVGVRCREFAARCPFAAYLFEDARGCDVLQVVDRLLADGAEEAVDLRVVRDANHGDAHDARKDECVETHADHEIHVRDEGEQLARAVLVIEDGALLARPCGDGLCRPYVLGVLHGQEDDARVQLAHDGVTDLGEDFLVVLPALPVAHGDADDGLCPVRPVAAEDGASCGASDGMDAEHGICRALHRRVRDAEAAQLCH